MRRLSILALSLAAATLAGCSAQPGSEGDEAGAAGDVEATPSPDAPVSILRPDIERPDVPSPALEPLNVVIGFPDGGAELDADAVAALGEVVASAQYASGAPIVLRAHSDSDGTDEANADASEARGLAVAAWLIDKGVDEDRIDVIVFGEQNPIEPNALPDGSPNEAGRAANRRVEVLIVPPNSDGSEAAQASVGETNSAQAGD